MAVISLLLLLGVLQGSAPDAQTLRGVVRDQTGAVLQGARVDLLDERGAPSSARSMTDAAGTSASNGSRLARTR